MNKILTIKSSNKQSLVSVAFSSEYPKCEVTGEEAIRILKASDDDGHFNLQPYGKSKVFKIYYGELGKNGTISGTPSIESLDFCNYVKLGRPSVISVERTEVYKNLD